MHEASGNKFGIQTTWFGTICACCLIQLLQHYHFVYVSAKIFTIVHSHASSMQPATLKSGV
jgi:hypothetical protein